MSESCKTCRFHVVVVDRFSFSTTHLQCRRYPPAVDPNSGHIATPRVRETDWCGEYAARSPEPAGEIAGVDADKEQR